MSEQSTAGDLPFHQAFWSQAAQAAQIQQDQRQQQLIINRDADMAQFRGDYPGLTLEEDIRHPSLWSFLFLDKRIYVQSHTKGWGLGLTPLIATHVIQAEEGMGALYEACRSLTRSATVREWTVLQPHSLACDGAQETTRQPEPHPLAGSREEHKLECVEQIQELVDCLHQNFRESLRMVGRKAAVGLACSLLRDYKHHLRQRMVLPVQDVGTYY